MNIFGEVRAYFREVSEYFREVSAYFRLETQARKRHININVLARLPLTPGLSWLRPRFVPGTNPGFLLILHSGSPVCPRDKTGDEGWQKKFMC